MRKLTLMLRMYFIYFILVIIGCSSIPENMAVSIDGVEISFTTTGQGNPTLVFVHGWGSERSRWKGQVAHFSDKHRIVTLDLPGFGESGNDREVWTMDAYGADVVSVLKRLNIKNAVLVGHSMGAYAVLEAARKAPQRIIGLVPVDMLQNVEETYAPEALDERLAQFQAYVENPEVTVPTIGWMECIRDAMVYRERLPDVLKHIQPPIHCINSDQQPTLVAVARKYAASFDADIVEGVGHSVMIDAPEAFNRLLEEIVEEFLSKAEAE